MNETQNEIILDQEETDYKVERIFVSDKNIKEVIKDVVNKKNIVK